MADVDTQVADPTTPEPQEAEARKLGWRPLDEFKGKEENWVSAEIFLDRGQQIMPLLKKTNEQLTNRLSATEQRLLATEATANELRTALKDLTTFQAAEIKRQVDSEVTRLRTEKTAAIRDGEHELAAALDEQLDAAKARQVEVAKPAPAPAPRGPQIDPEVVIFAEANKDWLGKDRRKTALFTGIADEIKETTGLVGKALLEKAKEEMEETLAPQGRPASKTEGTRGGGSGSSNGSGEGSRTYADLPAEAKQVVKDQEAKFVGPNKAFKTAKEWQAHYASVYFGS